MSADAGLIRRAAEIIQTGGLRKEGYFDDEGRHCLVGALKRAKGDVIMSHVADELPVVAEVLAEQFTFSPSYLGIPLSKLGDFGKIVSFNDHPDTTADDVVMVLEKAAIRAEEVVL